MLELIAVGIGGFVGAILRFLTSTWVQRTWGQTGFPAGTLTVNVVGCLIMGLLGGLAEHRNLFNPHVRLIVFLGILGSFTTFSAFGYETLLMLRDGQFMQATTGAGLHLILGLAAVWAGYTISTMV